MKVAVQMSNGTTYESSTIEEAVGFGFYLYRQPHDLEMLNYNLDNEVKGRTFMGPGYRNGPIRNAVVGDPNNPHQKPMPEVYRIWPDHQTMLNCSYQFMWRYINWDLPDNRWSSLMGPTLAWMNKTGSPPRRNCVTRERMNEKDPSFHAPILNGGAILKGTEGYRLSFAIKKAISTVRGLGSERTISNLLGDLTNINVLNIKSKLTSSPVPDLSNKEVAKKWCDTHPWLWYWGDTITREGRINSIVRSNYSGVLTPVRILFATRLPVYAPLSWFQKLPPGTPIPDYRTMA